MYGSLNNRIAEKALPLIPKPGMDATRILYSDRHAYTIIDVAKETKLVKVRVKFEDGRIGDVTREYPKYIIATRDKATLVSGSCQDGTAKYEFTTTHDSPETYIFDTYTCNYRRETLRRNVNGEFVRTGKTNRNQDVLAIGYKREYYDPHF